MESSRNGMWYYSGCIFVSTCAMMTSIRGIGSVMHGMGVKIYFLEEGIVQADRGSGFGF